MLRACKAIPNCTVKSFRYLSAAATKPAQKYEVISKLPPASWSLKSIYAEPKPLYNEKDLERIAELCLLRLPDSKEERGKLVDHLNNVFTAAGAMIECLQKEGRTNRIDVEKKYTNPLHSNPEYSDTPSSLLDHKTAMECASVTRDGFYVVPSSM